MMSLVRAQQGEPKKKRSAGSAPFSFFVSRIVQVRRVSQSETLRGLLARRCERPAGGAKVRSHWWSDFLLFTMAAAVWYNEKTKEVCKMTKINLWVRAKEANLQVANEILPGFDIGFDKEISKELQDELRAFVTWVENNFNIPITLWVDFEYKHYLISESGARVGYLFYWSDFSCYPVFQNKDDIPIIRLPVRTERSTVEEILGSFIEAITDYFAWICNEITDDFEPRENDVDEILAEYLRFRG